MKFRRSTLTLAVQLALLRSNSEGQGSLARNHLKWRWSVRPTALSREYSLRLSYKLGRAPEVFVLHPNLRALSEGRELPHVYSQEEQRLCLYLPRGGEWSPEMRLTDTFLPWASLWLYYFEMWLLTGEWKGGGVHPDQEDSKSGRRRR